MAPSVGRGGNSSPQRFQPAYINNRGQKTTRVRSAAGFKYKRDPKRYWYDSLANEYVTERQYVKRNEGWTKEAKTRARARGYATPFDVEVGQRSAALRTNVRYTNLLNSYMEESRRRGLFITRSQARRQGSEFNELLHDIAIQEDLRRALLSNGFRNSVQYRFLTNPNGRYAQNLVRLGLRPEGALHAVGDS